MMAAKLIYGVDVIDGLKQLESESVNCVVTSPPYWGLRDYGVATQIGAEKTPEEFIEKLVDVFREVKRVLKKDGTLWLNLGDTYNNVTPGSRCPKKWPKQARNDHKAKKSWVAALPPKNLIGIPWRVALALQASGWYLRSDIIWSKPNPMPESVSDRPTKSHEYIFLLTKSDKYFYDHKAIMEPCLNPKDDVRRKAAASEKNKSMPTSDRNGIRPSAKKGTFHGKTGETAFRAVTEKRNKRTVWEIATMPYPQAHFATFPMEIPKICIMAGCPQGGGSA